MKDGTRESDTLSYVALLSCMPARNIALKYSLRTQIMGQLMCLDNSAADQPYATLTTSSVSNWAPLGL